MALLRVGTLKRRASTAWSISPAWMSSTRRATHASYRERPSGSSSAGTTAASKVAGTSPSAGVCSVRTTSCQPLLRAGPVERRHARDLRQVVEHDHRRRQVEDGIRHGERVRIRHRHALPAGGCLVGQVPDAGGEREGRIAGHRLDGGKGCAERLERIVAALHDERSALDPGDRVAAVSGAALDALEQEGASRAKAQGGRNRRERVGRQLDAGDAGRCRGRHRSCSGYNEASIRSGTEACSAVPPLVRT